MIRILYIAILLLLSLSMKAQQDTIYLDSYMRQVKKRAKAKECAIIEKKENGNKLINFYTLDGKLLRCSQYKRFGKDLYKHVLHGATHYKFSNSNQDSLLVFYGNNKRNGGAIFYYPNGETMTNGQYKDGQLNGLLKQFYENGELKRMESYKDNCSEGGKYLAPDGKELAFTPFYKEAEFIAGEDELIRITAKAMVVPTDLVRKMADTYQHKVSATLGIVVDSSGQAVDFVILATDNPKFNKACFPNLLQALEGKTFIPGEIDNKKATTITVIKDVFNCAISPI